MNEQLLAQLLHGAAQRYLKEVQLALSASGSPNVVGEDLVLNGLLAICGYSVNSGHDVPAVVYRMLSGLAKDAQDAKKAAV